MNMDARITPKVNPCFGCHSDLDYLRKTAPNRCTIANSSEERACDGCSRQAIKQQEQQKNGISQ